LNGLSVDELNTLGSLSESKLKMLLEEEAMASAVQPDTGLTQLQEIGYLGEAAAFR
jgi:hypothetical protein